MRASGRRRSDAGRPYAGRARQARCGGLRAGGHQQPVLDRPEDGLRARGDLDLGVGAADVGLHRVDAEVGLLGDVAVGQARRDHREHLGLTVRQRPGVGGGLGRLAPAGPGVDDDATVRGLQEVPDESAGGQPLADESRRTARHLGRHGLGAAVPAVGDHAGREALRDTARAGRAPVGRRVVEGEVGQGSRTAGAVGHHRDDGRVRLEHRADAVHHELALVHEGDLDVTGSGVALSFHDLTYPDGRGTYAGR